MWANGQALPCYELALAYCVTGLRSMVYPGRSTMAEMSFPLHMAHYYIALYLFYCLKATGLKLSHATYTKAARNRHNDDMIKLGVHKLNIYPHSGGLLLASALTLSTRHLQFNV